MNRGYVLAAAAGVAWGTIPLTVKQIYVLGSPSPLHISFFRFIIAFLVLFPLNVRRKTPIILRDKWSLLMGFFGVFFMSSVSFYGIQYTSAVNATILFNCNPLMVAVLVLLLKWEKLTPQLITGILLGMSGVVLISGVDVTLTLVGDLLVLLGAFGWAVYTVLGYRLRAFSSLSVTTSSLLWGLPFFGAVLWREPAFTPSAWVWVVYMGIVPTAFAFLSYVRAVDSIGSTRASVFQYLAPFVAVLLSLVLNLEAVHLYQIAGSVLIILGIELTRRSSAP